ncbi:MAG TPA: peptidylprolyl isomerase [Anaerolineales bacterium]|nr:peptidylprolyl isomerase [Anaerolineales bacterium]
MKRPIFKILLFFLCSLFLITACAAPQVVTPSANMTLPTDIIVATQPACTSLAAEPTPGPETPSVFPPVTGADHIRGAKAAAVTILEYSDYQDPRSGELAKATKQLLEENPNEIQVVTRPFPIIVVNDKAAIAALAAEASAEQGKFWEMHDLLFAQQASWINLSVDDFKQWLLAHATDLGMDLEKFRSDYVREDLVAKVQKAWDDGQKMGLPGTPIVVINGDLYQGPRDYTSLNDISQLIILGKRQFTDCPPVTVNPKKQYIATLHTEKGDVTLQLFADKAPITVNSFIFLAKNGWYDNITFHRVIPKLFAQTGDPSGTGKGNPGYYLITEILPSLTFSNPGMVAMVNSGPNTSGGQFFITYAPTGQFDGKYTIFGQVLTGMDVLQSLTPRDAQPGANIPPGDKLIDITIVEK